MTLADVLGNLVFSNELALERDMSLLHCAPESFCCSTCNHCCLKLGHNIVGPGTLLTPNSCNGLVALLEVLMLQLVDMRLRCGPELSLQALQVRRELLSCMLNLSS